MSDNFKAVVNTTVTHTLVTVSGVLGEEADFPEVSIKLPIRINFKNLTRLNSRGIKKWYLWSHKFKAPTQLFLEDCPAMLINCFNMVKGGLTPQMQVESFYVPLYSEATGERKDVLLVRGRDFGSGKVNVPPQKDSKGRVMELDVYESYFNFLGQA